MLCPIGRNKSGERGVGGMTSFTGDSRERELLNRDWNMVREADRQQSGLAECRAFVVGGRPAIIQEPGPESCVARAEGPRGESELSRDFIGGREKVLQEAVPAALTRRRTLRQPACRHQIGAGRDRRRGWIKRKSGNGRGKSAPRDRFPLSQIFLCETGPHLHNTVPPNITLPISSGCWVTAGPKSVCFCCCFPLPPAPELAPGRTNQADWELEGMVSSPGSALSSHVTWGIPSFYRWEIPRPARRNSATV